MMLPIANTDNIYIYDKTFEGFLTLIFEIYQKKIEPACIEGKEFLQQKIFFNLQEVITDDAKAERVWNSLKKKMSSFGYNSLYYVFLSGLEGMEMLLYHYIKKVFACKLPLEYNYSDEHVIELEKIKKKVLREAQRMLMFVRFQETSDGLYYCGLEPKYDVLSMVTNHFTDRFADQKWVIYDLHRKYGFYYDLHETFHVTFDDTAIVGKSIWLPPEVIHEQEQLFQNLWKEYFHALTIKERINPRLQMQHMPKRFWKYLPEKR